jgi:hypothetical protein
VQDHVAVPQDQPIGHEGRGTDWKRKKYPSGRQGNICDARKDFAAQAQFQMVQSQPRQPCLEVAGTCYGEIDARIAESRGIAVGVAKRECTAFCHLPRPVGPADIGCDLLKLPVCSIAAAWGWLAALGYAGSEARCWWSILTHMQFRQTGGRFDLNGKTA